MNPSLNLEAERTRVYQEEGRSYPGDALVRMELAPGYERAKRMLSSIKTINEAHLIMLEEQEIVTPEDAATIMRAVRGVDYKSYKTRTYSGKFEDLYFEMEDEIISATGGVGGNLHLARSRNDMCVAWAHMSVRDEILALMQRMIRLQNTALLFAKSHKDTIYVIHTHTQHAQPGLFGHYFLGLVDVLERNIARLIMAYGQTNVSPMGAAAVTTTGFPISRERVAQLSGFDGVIENAYDAIGNCEYFTGTAASIGLMALDLGRIVTDMVLWATEEEQMIRVADGYISTSSIMPQKRNPIALEHLRASLSVVKGLCDAVQLGFLKSPYGDISDYEDVEDTMHMAFETMDRNLQLFNAVLATLDVNKELLAERVHESFSVVTEIADQMVRSYGIPFRQAHHFVATLVKKSNRLGYNLKQLSLEFFSETFMEVFQHPFEGDFTPILKSIDPENFVAIREILGGTGQKAMAAMIESGKAKVEKNRQWLAQAYTRIEQADEERAKQVSRICLSGK